MREASPARVGRRGPGSEGDYGGEENQRLKDYLGASFDEISIDEVQDLRCLEIELLLSMTKDGRAFHFAGDTAQIISQDSHFRFQDIKALFYDHFVTEVLLTNQSGLARPRLFLLAKNYRFALRDARPGILSDGDAMGWLSKDG